RGAARMIKFHYHRARRAIPRLGIEVGDPLCHVYSDASREELEAWGVEHGLRPEWIHKGTLPHFDAFGERLAACGPGVTGREFGGDIRDWRARAR
ncbi:MAG: hypothetical protein ACRELC_10355, partial [Gemmatimonadota bacterium]